MKITDEMVQAALNEWCNPALDQDAYREDVVAMLEAALSAQPQTVATLANDIEKLAVSYNVGECIGLADWAAFEAGIAKGLEAAAEHARSALTAAPAQEPFASIVPEHCSATNFVFEGGCLHVRKDGSGYIVVDEDDFILEDDRCEGPDGPEGSVHWIAKFASGQMTALRDFLNGQRFTADQSARIAELEAQNKWLIDRLFDLELSARNIEDFEGCLIERGMPALKGKGK